MKLRVNGASHSIDEPGVTSLLSLLRESLRVTSPKPGCEQGGCGACTVLIDGLPHRSCLVPVASLDGAEVVTLEGLSDGDRLTPLQQAFYEEYAAQCGYCTPGMIVAATHLLSLGNETVTRQDIETIMGGHLCRCTGYVKIFAAVEAAARRQARTVDKP